MRIIYFGLGTNLGDRIKNLHDAIDKLKTIGNIERISSIYETKAWGGVVQPDYLNACVKMKLFEEMAPIEILRTIKNFEHELGRIASERWGARKIDIDILLSGDEVYHSEELDIPHIMLPKRLFVLVPLSEILPSSWKHPVNGKTVKEMIATLSYEAQPMKYDVYKD